MRTNTYFDELMGNKVFRKRFKKEYAKLKEVEMEKADKQRLIVSLKQLSRALKSLNKFERAIEKNHNIKIDSIIYGKSSPEIDFIYNKNYYYSFKSGRIKKEYKIEGEEI